MATQKDLDFEGSTLRAEIDRVDLSKRAKDFLRAIADLAHDRQSYEGSLAVIAERMNASYQTARRAKIECFNAGVITTVEPPGKVWTWSIDWGHLLDLPSAPEQKRPKRAPRRRESSPKPQQVFLRPEIPRAVLSLITLWSWLTGKHRTPSTPSTFVEVDPLQMGAPTLAPPPLLSATPSTFDADPLHFAPEPPPNGRAQVRNPLQMGAPTPSTSPHIDIYDNIHTHIDIHAKPGKSRWGKRLNISKEDLPDPETWVDELKRLQSIGFFEGVEEAWERYIAFRIKLRRYIYSPKDPKRPNKIPATSLYGAGMHRGTWIDEHDPEDLEQARQWVAKLRSQRPLVAAGGGRNAEDSAAHLP